MSGNSTEAPPVPDSGLALCAAQQRRWLLWRAQKMSFFLLYDFAGGIILLNIICIATVFITVWAVASALPMWGWPPVAVVAILVPPLLAGQASFLAALLAEEEFALHLYWRGVRTFAVVALGLAFLYGVAGLITGLGIWFYLGQMAPSRPLLGNAMAGLCIGTALVLVLSSIFSLPALVHQHGSLRKAVAIGFALIARHPVLSIGLLITVVAWGMVLLTPPGLLLLSTWPVVALGTCTYELLARDYALKEALAKGEMPPADALDKDDIFLNRGFTDLLFPWKT